VVGAGEMVSDSSNGAYADNLIRLDLIAQQVRTVSKNYLGIGCYFFNLDALKRDFAMLFIFPFFPTVSFVIFQFSRAFP
jgi:hypothetical protein